jgi:hypothetical protein
MKKCMERVDIAAERPVLIFDSDMHHDNDDF